MKYLSGFLLLISAAAFAQTYSDVALQNSSSNYARVVPHAVVTVCASTDTATPCTNRVTTYTDQTLTTPCTLISTISFGNSGGNGGATSGTNCNNPGLADANGNFTVFAPVGLYRVCILSQNYLCLLKTVPATAGTLTMTPVTVSGLASIPGKQRGTIATITDGVNYNDCVTGGGSLQTACIYTGTVWVSVGEHRSTVYVTPTNWTWSQALAAGNFPALTGSSPATVTLAPCPNGIDTSGNPILGGPNGGYKVKLNDVTHTEAVSVTGGTCTSNAASGTIIFTPFFSYAAGAYTISSGSNGIQEAINVTCGANTVHTYNNGFCNVFIGPNSPVTGTPTSYTVYDVWGTIYFHATQSMLWGYGATLACHNSVRAPCLQIGNLTGSNDYVQNTVLGVSFQTPDTLPGTSDLNGNLIATTAYSAGTNTITTAVAHNFRNGDFVTIMATDNPTFWGDIPSITVTNATTFTYPRTRGATIAAANTPGLAILQTAAVLDNINSTHFIDVNYSHYGNGGSFSNFFDFWDDEEAVIDDFASNGIGLTVSSNWMPSYVYSMGANNLPAANQQLASVITVQHSAITAQRGACATVTNSNGLYISDTICQASGPWQFKVSNLQGNFQGAFFQNVYSESSANSNNNSPWSGLGVAGLIAGQSAGPATFTLRGNGAFVGAGIPTIAGGSGTPAFVYYIVAHDTTSATATAPMAVAYAKQNAGAITVSWPRIAPNCALCGATDTITYDVLRVPAPSGTIQIANGGFVGPYFSGCAGGSPTVCGSIATAVAQCAGFVCSTTDNTANNTASYAIPASTFPASPDFWPGQAVMTSTQLYSDTAQSVTPISFNVGSTAAQAVVQITQTCNNGSAANSYGVTSCLSSNTGSSGLGWASAMFNQDVGSAPSVFNVKGLYNLSVGQFSLYPHAWMTFIDSSFKSKSTTGGRPAMDAGDSWIGWDDKSSGETILSNTGFYSFGTNNGYEWFINSVPNNSGAATATNWTEQLTAAAHSFTGNILFGTDNSKNIGAAGANRPKSIFVGSDIDFSAGLLLSNTAPTISAGFGATPSIANNNGTGAFTINVGTGGTASTGTIGLPIAPHGWYCTCTDITTNSATVFACKQTGAGTTTTVPIGEFTAAGAAQAWTASDIVAVSCMAY